MILRVKRCNKQNQRLDHSLQIIIHLPSAPLFFVKVYLLTWMADWEYGKVFMVFMVDIDIDID